MEGNELFNVSDKNDENNEETNDEELKNIAEEDEEEEIFEVESIVKHRKTKDNKTMYFIKWKGYPSSKNTWEPQENLQCPQLLEEYWKKQKDPKKSEQMFRIKYSDINVSQNQLSIPKSNQIAHTISSIPQTMKGITRSDLASLDKHLKISRIEYVEKGEPLVHIEGQPNPLPMSEMKRKYPITLIHYYIEKLSK